MIPIPHLPRRRAIALTIAAAFGVAAATHAAAASPASDPPVKPTIVLVHGAFADASSWNGVIADLQADGYTAVALANPLRGLHADAAYTASLVNQIDGCVVLVGHTSGGAVISNAATDTPNVAALVVVAGFFPDKGERLDQVEAGSTDSELGPALVPHTYPTGRGVTTETELTVDTAQFRAVFAADLPESQTALLAATQRPASRLDFAERSGKPAWRTLPSWAVVATQDKAAGTDITLAMAQRAGATITEVAGSHLVMISQPQAVSAVIEQAATAVDGDC